MKNPFKTTYDLFGASAPSPLVPRPSSLSTSDLLKKVRKIEIKTRGLSNDIFSGEYHSAFKGRGMSFAEVRPYQYGDDVRTIDWNVTARYNEPYIKTFEEERELTVILLIDVSKSDNFGTVNVMKSDFMTEIAAVLSFSAITNNDKVGVIFFSDHIEKFIPPKKGKSHILRIIRELIDFKADGKGTDVAEALRYLSNAIKKKCTCFLLSDFIDEGYVEALKMAHKKHDLIGIRIYDPMEMALPNAGLIKMRDAESEEERWIDTSDKRLREAYRIRQQQLNDYFKRSFSKNGVDMVEIRADESYIKALRGFFKSRNKR